MGKTKSVQSAAKTRSATPPFRFHPVTISTGLDFSNPDKIKATVITIPGEVVFCVDLYEVAGTMVSWLTSMNLESQINSTTGRYSADWTWQNNATYRVVAEAYLWAQDSEDDTSPARAAGRPGTRPRTASRSAKRGRRA
jgi:hypothetical protein